MISWEDFEKIDIRVGKIIGIEDFPEARIPAYKLTIDFGKEFGIKRSSAQLVNRYSKEDLLNRQVLAVVNFPPKQIGKFMSEVLTLGIPTGEGDCYLIVPDKNVPIGGKLY